MPGRVAELPLSRIRSVLLLFLLAPGPGSLRAQEPEGRPYVLGSVRGHVELSAGLTSLHGEAVGVLGAAGLLSFSPRWRAGGAGLVLGRVSLDDPAAPGEELSMGYGGVLVRWSPGSAPGDPGLPWEVGALVGAGNAEVRDPVAGVRRGSDNFLVLAPTVSLRKHLAERVGAAVAAGWRLAFSVDDLAGVDEGDLRGWTLGLELRLGPF